MPSLFIPADEIATPYDLDLELPDQTHPEKNLLVAVLESAISDLLAPKVCDVTTKERPTKTAKIEAYHWLIKSPIKLDRLEPFTFSWICQALDLDPYGLRQELRRRYFQRDMVRRWGGHLRDRGYHVKVRLPVRS